MATLLPRVRVTLIREDLFEVVSDVFEHELPILLAAFGAGNVVPVEGAKVKPGVIEDGVDGEYARLKRKFRRPNSDASPVARAYPSAADLARAIGVDYQPHTGLAPSLPESYQYDGEQEESSDESQEPVKRGRGRPPKVVEQPAYAE